jgi:hypothetical protein
MGHDLTIIGRHKLDTSTPQKLAIDLSKALKARVEYYIKIWNNKNDTSNDPEYLHQFTVGEEFAEVWKMFAQIDDSSKFNEQNYFEDKFSFDIEVWDNKYDRHFYLGLDSLIIQCEVLCRWYVWVEWFKNPDYCFDKKREVPSRVWIEEQRNLIYDDLKRFGGNEVLIFSDQQEFQNFEYEIMYKTFDQIKNEFQEAVGDRIRYIPKELAGYPEKDKYEDSGVENFPVFYNDFVGIEH